MSENDNPLDLLVEGVDWEGSEFTSGLTEEVLEGGVKKNRYYIEGICIQTDVKNRNGRIYPYGIMKPVIDSHILNEVAQGRSVGELNHPADGRLTIEYEKVSHKFESLTEDGKNWRCRAIVADKTPMGSIVAGLMDVGVKMGISSRAGGKTKTFQGVKIVQPGVRLVTPGDIVTDPSAPDAYLTNLMEGKEWVYANGVLFERETEIKAAVNTMAKRGQLDKTGTRRLFNAILNEVRRSK